MSVIYVGVGSNSGNREENIEKAFLLMEENGIKILKRSSIIETDPVGGPLQGKFLNAVIKIETRLDPLGLLNLLQGIELKLGRVREIYHGPRTIDLDILMFDDVTMHTPELTIPHPRMFEREFVLMPLREIAAEILKK